MQKYSNSELLKDNLIPFHIHQWRIQTSVLVLWELVKSEMEDETGGDKLQKIFRPMKGNPRKSWILDSTPWIPDSLSVELGFRIPICSGFPDS